MAKGITLKTKNGATGYPKSVTDLIFDNATGKTLKTLIDELKAIDAATDTRTQFYKASVTDLDALNAAANIGTYNYVGNGWRGLVQVCLDHSSNVAQVALSSSSPSYDGNVLSWFAAQPCAMARVYRNGAWSHWEKVGAPVVNDLTTGGTDKALSAEMGKTLKEGLDALGPELSDADALALTESSGNLNIDSTNSVIVSGTTQKCYYAAVNAGDKLRISATNSESKVFRYGFTAVVPAVNVEVSGATYVSNTSIGVTIVAPINGYVVLAHGTSYFTNHQAALLSSRLGRVDDEVFKLKREIGDYSVSSKRVDYADITMTKGAVVGSTGANASSDNFYRTPFIDIDGYDKVKFLAFVANLSALTFGYAFYSSNEASSYISGSRCDVDTSLEGFEQKEYTIDIPSGAKYIRTCIYKDFRTSYYLEATAGTPLKDRVDALEEGFASLPQDLEGTLEGLGDSIEELNEAVTNTETLGFTFRFGDTNVNTGAPNSSSLSGCIRTGLVSIKAGTSITIDSGYQFKVDVYSASPASSSTWISAKRRAFSANDYVAEEDILAIIVMRKYPIVTPPDVAWAEHIHVTYTSALKDELIELDNRVTALESPNTDDYNHGPWGLKPSEFDKGYYICGQTQVRTDLELTFEPNSSGISECTNDYEDVIGWMDALMALANVSNTTISKVPIGTSSDNRTLYEYIFTPKRYAVTGFPVKQQPIVLIDACIHGFEKNSFFAWYAFLKDMLTRSDSVQLDAVARNVEIHFVPVSNPYGFDNNSYFNANHVNLNRNFESSDWESITEGTDQSGYADNPQPFDQLESQAIRDWILTYPNAMMVFTSHTNGRVTNGYEEMNACMTRFGVAGEYFDRLADVIRRHITEQTQQIPRIYNLNIGSAFCGRWQYSESHGGTEVTWVREAAQIPAMTLETFNGLRVDGSYVIGQFSNNSIKCCAEICGNLLLQVLIEYAE